MERSFWKLERFLKRHPSLHSDSEEIEEILVSRTPNLEAITKKSRSTIKNTVLSLPSAFACETIPPVDPNSLVMAIAPRGYKVDSKPTSLPELFNLQFIETNYQSDPQLSTIREILKERYPTYAMRNS